MTYNRAATIIDALDSVAHGAQPPTRLIIVDDGSTDDTRERVHAWMQLHGGLCEMSLLSQPNQGVGAARANAIAAAQGTHLLSFLDSDDLWPADFLQRATAAFEHQPAAVAVHCDQEIIDGLSGDSRWRLDMSCMHGDVSRALLPLLGR